MAFYDLKTLIFVETYLDITATAILSHFLWSLPRRFKANPYNLTGGSFVSFGNHKEDEKNSPSHKLCYLWFLVALVTVIVVVVVVVVVVGKKFFPEIHHHSIR
uniref:Uncharacterized protein n=1 Tax=Glossina brevipalpis TaxID=37001 RepID=A0A1A9WL22_9MUSC